MIPEALRAWAIAIGVALCASCVTTADVSSARTLGAGKSRLGVQLELGDTIDLTSPPTQSALVPTPSVEYARGLRDDLDVGIRLGTGGFEARAKWRLRAGTGASPTVSIAPSAMASWYVLTWAAHVSLPVLVSVEIAPSTELTAMLSARYVYFAGTPRAFIYLQQAHWLIPGGGFGISHQFTPDKSLGASLSVYGPMISWPNVGSNTSQGAYAGLLGLIRATGDPPGSRGTWCSRRL